MGDVRVARVVVTARMGLTSRRRFAGSRQKKVVLPARLPALLALRASPMQKETGMSSSPIPPDHVRSLDSLLTVSSKPLVDRVGTVVLVTVSGEIDMVGTPVLATELATVLRITAPKIVLVDLSAVSFLDSTGISALIDAHNRAQASSTHLRLYGASRVVRRPLELTGVTELLEIYDTRAAALTDMQPS